MILRMAFIGTLVVANVLFTMVTHRHLWSQKDVLDKRIASSIVEKTVTAKRGTIYDRNHTVIAQQTKAYTIVAYLDSGVVDANGNPNYVKNIESTAKKLKSVLGDEVDEKTLIKIMKSAKKVGKSQTELGAGTKRIKKSAMKEIKKLKIDSLLSIDSYKVFVSGNGDSARFSYKPYSQLMIESYYEKYLKRVFGIYNREIR